MQNCSDFIAENVNNISVITISYNPGDLLENCLNKLSFQDAITSPNNSEWIVIDNNSTDGSLDKIIKRYPKIKVIRNFTNKGFAYAANQGYRLAENEYVLYINTDVEIRTLAISKMLDVLQKNLEIAVIGPRLLRPNGSIQKSVLTYPSFWDGFIQPYIKLKLHFKEKMYNEKIWYEVPLIKGACFLMRKSICDLLGGFDENFFFYYEETDLFYRVISRGYKIAYMPSAEVVHIGGASVKKSRDNFKKHFRESYIKYLKKHKPKWQSYFMEKHYKLFRKI